MRRTAILTLTTDFGSDGPYVAAIKGVVLGLAPEVRFVDVSHVVAPQNVREGAFLLADLVDVFPSGTVHLAVVDPGVGTNRRLIAARVAEQWFVLPDNGLISGVIRNRPATEIRAITNPSIRRATVSATFHGRDILAPAAAHLLRGGDPDELGPKCTVHFTLGDFEPSEDPNGWNGLVIFRDTFGNLITNIAADRLAGVPPEGWSVEIAGERIVGVARTYAEHPPGALIALIGSTGWLEVAEVNGHAARRLAVGPETPVTVRRRKTP